MKPLQAHRWRNPFLILARAAWLVCLLSYEALEFFLIFAGSGARPSARKRALWVHRGSRRVLRIFRPAMSVRGDVPCGGLLVCNHLSYLDILVLASITPAVFVSKSDVKGWPVFGRLARMGGTLFVRRDLRADVSRLNGEMEQIMADGVLVVLFPEGTSSDGSQVLPFKTALLEPAVRQTHPLYAGSIAYELADGDASEEVCYWRDMVLVPHLLNLLSKRRLAARVSFARITSGPRDRKELARILHAAVARLKRCKDVTESLVDSRSAGSSDRVEDRLQDLAEDRSADR